MFGNDVLAVGVLKEAKNRIALQSKFRIILRCSVVASRAKSNETGKKIMDARIVGWGHTPLAKRAQNERGRS